MPFVSATKKPFQSLASFLLAALLLGGALLRTYGFYQSTDFLHDEVISARLTDSTPLGWYTLNEATYSPGYATIRKWGSHFLGSSKQSHAYASYVFSILSLLVFTLLVLRLVPHKLAWFPVGLFALSPETLKFSIIAKQYTLDQFCCLLVVYLATRLRFETIRLKHLYLLTAICSVSFWISFPSAFVVAAMWLWTCIQMFHLRKKYRITMVFLSVLLGVSFLALYQLVLANKIGHSLNQEAWGGHFMPLMFWTSQGWQKVCLLGYKLFSQVARFPWPILSFMLSLIGLAYLSVRNAATGFILFATILITAMASMFELYPFSNRCLVFLVPFLCLTLGLSVAVLKHPKIAFLGQGLASIFLIVVAVAGTPRSKSEFQWSSSGIRLATSLLNQRLRQQDIILIRTNHEKLFPYYTALDSLGRMARGHGPIQDYTWIPRHTWSQIHYFTYGVWNRPITENHARVFFKIAKRLPAPRRLWILQSSEYKEELFPLLRKLRTIGTVSPVFLGKKYVLYRFSPNWNPRLET